MGKVKTPVDGFKTITKPNGLLKQIRIHSYVAMLTEKDGHEVKAVRYDGYETKKAVSKLAKEEYPDWNVKGVWRLYDEDF